ncbi:MAG: DUF2231 domain-containing protein [Vicinamibacterales bacterium]
MRSSAHVKGHPLHPMLIPFPFAYLFGAACLDIAGRAARRSAWHSTARHLRVMGIGSGLAAAVPGLIDYWFAVPPRSSAARRATWHGLANLTAVGLFAAVQGRRGGKRLPAVWELAAQTGAAGLMGLAGWMGGTLVYRNQIGVDHRYADAGKWQSRSVAGAAQEAGDTQEVDAGAADSLRVGQLALLEVGDRRLVLARTEEGLTAFDDRCTHKGGPLSDGALVCGTVQCPWHGSQFDVHSGAVRHGPAEQAIRTYGVSERDGRLWVRLR